MYGDDTILTWGKYKFWKLKDVPQDYLLGVFTNGCHSKELIEYVKLILESIKQREFKPKPLVPFVCDKITFPNETEAKFALKNIKGKDQKHKKPIRVYECPQCSGWHLTSREDYFSKFTSIQ